ncbi:hypothetical protein EJ110_NYTH24011 [Nymphaea thermarum]|nr:hypothetical protein EJ110_NYTH24011 [Nymphaea thermarum]
MWPCVWELSRLRHWSRLFGAQAVQGPRVLLCDVLGALGSRLPNLGVLGKAEYLSLEFTHPWMSALPLLYGHIDGTTPAPPKYIDHEVKRTVVADQAAGTPAGIWLAHDQSLVAYITSTLSEEVLRGVDDDLTALELWSTLATTYSQVSEARFLQLKRQFQDIKRGTRTVLEYLNEIKSVSDQLAVIGHPVSDKDKVQQALSGLGTDFDIFCTVLEVLPVLPSFEDLKAKLFQHEASRVQ